jgi:hypothetical protein
MASYRRSEVISGLFVTLAIAVLGLFAFRVGSFDLLGLFKGEVLVCKSYFTDVKTLEPGQEVKVGGQPVGKVTAVRMVARALTEKQVRQLRDFHEEKAASGLSAGMRRQLIEVEFELSDPGLRLDPGSARARLSQGSLISSHFLDLDPGEWEAHREPATIFESGFDEEVVIAADEGTGFEELVAIMKPVVREMDLTLKTINQRLLSPENSAAVASILKQLDETAGDLRQVAQRVESFVGEEGSRLRGLVGDLARTAAGLEGRLATVQADVRAFTQSGQAILEENRSEIAESVRRLNRTLWHAELALRKIRLNPATLLFGDDEADFQTLDADESGLRYSGRLRPYEQRDEGERTDG